MIASQLEEFQICRLPITHAVIQCSEFLKVLWALYFSSWDGILEKSFVADLSIPSSNRYSHITMSSSIVHEYCPCISLMTLIVPFLRRYLITSFSFSDLFCTVSTGGRPPLALYCIPFIGHGMSFFWNTGVVNKLSHQALMLSHSPERPLSVTYW